MGVVLPPVHGPRRRVIHPQRPLLAARERGATLRVRGTHAA